MAGADELQVPPPVALVSVVVSPRHTDIGPVIKVGSGFTVTVAVTLQPVPNEYVISAVPADTPQVTPPVPAVATAGLLLLHAPPVVVLLSVVQALSHITMVPVIAAGTPLTVNTAAAAQPDGIV
jgi:hypothetical protein